MRIFACGFLLGICGIYAFSRIPNLYLLSAISLLMIAIYLWQSQHITRFFVAISLGLLWVMLFVHHYQQDQIPSKLESKTLTVTGYVASIPVPNSKIQRFTFAIKTINQQTHVLLAQLSWYQSGKARSIHVGEQWQLHVRLKKPHGFANPGGFDYEKYLFAHRIHATGYVVNRANNHLLSSHWYHYPLGRLRAYFFNQIYQQLKNEPLADLIPALTIGYRQTMTQQQWQILQNTGTAHLMAISGLHIGMIASLFFFLISYLCRFLPRLLLRYPTKVIAAVGAIIAALIYSMMAGFSLPTQRAFIMVSVFFLALVCRRQLISWHGFAWALFLVLLIDPLAVLSASFWLSFTAVAVIIHALSGRLKPPAKWQVILKMQFILLIGLLPLSLLIFQKTALSAPLVNLIAIPWVGFIVVPASLLGCFVVAFAPTLAHWLWLLAVKNLQYLWKLLTILAAHPLLVWHHTITPIALFFALLTAFIMLLPKGFPGKIAVVFLCLPVIAISSHHPKQGQALFTLLDVGQGLSAVVETARHTLVFDTGAKFSPTFNAGDSVLIPFLRNKHIKTIDVLMISHLDNDHNGGTSALLRQIPVKKIYSSIPNSIKPNNLVCQRGQQWQWDGIHFQVLFPINVSKKNCGNNCSCVLKISVGKQSVLLTGDIEKSAEKTLLDNSQATLASSILVAPHHGSKTSSTPAFIQAVNPKFVLFPVGYRNRFHFPAASVVQRYRDIGAKLFSTDHCGAISFKLGERLLQAECYREINKKLWDNL
ncbi:MAG: DNA internalization-related competence protein ComEC/Rec2 [Pseudomonadota bacterium]